jgi:hypothetical protein
MVGELDVVGWMEGARLGLEDRVGVDEGAWEGDLLTDGELEWAILGLKLTLGAILKSSHLKLAPSNTTQLSKMASPTSATANLMVFHRSSLYGSPMAVNTSVNPSASMVG